MQFLIDFVVMVVVKQISKLSLTGIVPILTHFSNCHVDMFNGILELSLLLDLSQPIEPSQCEPTEQQISH